MYSLNNNNDITFYKKNVSNWQEGQTKDRKKSKETPTFYIVIPRNEEYPPLS